MLQWCSYLKQEFLWSACDCATTDGHGLCCILLHIGEFKDMNICQGWISRSLKYLFLFCDICRVILSHWQKMYTWKTSSIFLPRNVQNSCVDWLPLITLNLTVHLLRVCDDANSDCVVAERRFLTEDLFLDVLSSFTCILWSFNYALKLFINFLFCKFGVWI